MQEGLPAQVTLGFRSEKNRIVTRAAQDESYENRVNNLYVFIFNPDGEVHYQGFYTDNDITYDTNAGRSKGQVSFSTTSLNNVQIVCIANLSTESVNSNYEVTQEEMKR